jgi:kinetochore protein Spc7/SPC105
LIDFSTPAPTHGVPTSAGAENVLDLYSPIQTTAAQEVSATTLPADDDQDATSEAKEAERLRRAQKQAILDQRAARRKSMANRRVSFAPEATLHTWNVIEMVEDSTTSSASNSTRRQSSITTAQTPNKTDQNLMPEPNQHEPPSTPPEQLEEPLVKVSPAHQRDLHQQRRRRSNLGMSNTPPEGVNLNESSPASTYSGSSAVGDSSPIHVEDSIHSSSGEDGDTAMSMDDATGQTVRSEVSNSSTASSLDGRLRRAAAEAGTRGIEYDENGDDLSMELAEGTITNAFQPWVKGHPQVPVQDNSATQDQENINPFSPAFKLQADRTVAQDREITEVEETQGATMDMTIAAGGILPKKSSQNKSRRKSVAPSRRRSSVARRRSSGEGSYAEDETMDLTMVGGGIVQQVAQAFPDHEISTVGSDEEMTMEMTNAVGGFIQSARSESLEGTSIDDTMDTTAAIGSILPSIEEQTEPQTAMQDNRTMDMDLTRAAGSILSNTSREDKSKAKRLMEAETDVGQLNNLSDDQVVPSPPRANGSMPVQMVKSVASETGSPSIALKQRLSGRRTSTTRSSLTPKSAVPQSSPLKESLLGQRHATPTKQLTPQALKAQTPERTPVMPNIMYRSASPKKLFKAEIKAKASPASSQRSAARSKSLFDHNQETGQQTPTVILHAPKPHQHLRRRSSGVGIDQEGLGSPRVSALLDRRRSIGDDAKSFIPQPAQMGRNLRFDDPKALEEQIDTEREEEGRRESGRFLMEQEADQPQYREEENLTQPLREMIESLTPKKNKLKGRKSLHVGAAKGILGKRPAELDLDDEEDVDRTPKRLRAVEREASPVKRVHLPQPPSKDETTGRITRGKRQSLEETAGYAQITPTLSKSPGKPSAAHTPQPKGRFRNTSTGASTALPTSFEDKLDNVVEAVDVSVLRDGPEQEVEKISLQEFLNMTNIHFIELSTTKRRHTLAPVVPSRPSQEASSTSDGACFAAAATTLPLLELYQHATRELKSYISTGRKIIRSIEQETLGEQPALFREYVDARPDVKMVMDNQFRNGKANARLQSKEGWYAWRRQLVEGLRGGLDGIKADMGEDAKSLTRQEAILEDSVPYLVKRFGELEQEAHMLQQRAEDFEGVDQECLNNARVQLESADHEAAQKTILLGQLQQQMADKAEALSAAEELKAEFECQIGEAERVQVECRGWKAEDVRALKERVRMIEQKTGWSLVTAEHEVEEGDVDFGPALTVRYRNELRLFFYPAAFQQISSAQNGRRNSRRSKSDNGPSAPVSLTYDPVEADGATSAELTTQQRFFLQLLQGHLHAIAVLPKGSTSPKTLLTLISEGWDLAVKVSNEIRLLEIAGITNVSILSDEKLGAACMLMLPDRSRVDVQFTLTAGATNEGLVSTNVTAEATPRYGSITASLTGSKASKICEALNKQANSKAIGDGAWVAAVRGLEDWVNLQKKGTNKVDENVEKEAAKPKPKPAPATLPIATAPQVDTPTPAPTAQKKELKKPVPMEEVMEEAAARQEELRRREEEEEMLLMSATKTPAAHGRRPGALRRSP